MSRPTGIGLMVLVGLYLLVNCISLAGVGYVFPDHHLGIDGEHLIDAILATLAAASLVPLFALARFSFGYLLGLAFYGMISGFIWIGYFSNLSYDHTHARLSAFASLLLFLLPVLFISVPIRRKIELSGNGMNRLLVGLFGCAIGLFVLNAFYGVALIGTQQGAELRGNLVRPSILMYLNGMMIGSVLPFAFAYFALQRRYWMAGLGIGLMLLFYPVLLTKTVLFAPIWLTFLFVMFRFFDPRVAAIVTPLIPLAGGLVVYAVASGFDPTHGVARYLFEVVNLRMFAVPSSAMDHYSEFFATNPRTNFCQISFLRTVMDCPYAKELGVIFRDRYNLGNFNASLFATEGTASVGPFWAPLSALVCGLLLSAANSASANLPASLVAVSSGLVVQALMNVPFSTTLLSNGLLVLLLLWYLTPSDLVEPSDLS